MVETAAVTQLVVDQTSTAPRRRGHFGFPNTCFMARGNSTFLSAYNHSSPDSKSDVAFQLSATAPRDEAFLQGMMDRFIQSAHVMPFQIASNDRRRSPASCGGIGNRRVSPEQWLAGDLAP
jgi:hypothetical protein